jgi:large subunit ribosomal protein L13
MKTSVLKTKDDQAKWYIVDATGKTLGRLATGIANVLMGKHKPNYTPHIVSGDVVVVINSAKIKVTGNKMVAKMYYRHSGYPGGLKEVTLKEKLQKDPNSVITAAVAGMLPKNKLQAIMLKNLKVYATDEHPHEPQQPTQLEIGE